MASDNPPSPELGTVYEDTTSGARCEVKTITTSPAFPGFYLVHLRITPTEGKEDTWVLGPREFEALARERLRPA
jgi:hypothetical protein